ncbi:MAG: ACT domain-containing protein [Candidatus Marinimicrobia bacterium]|nr:ACT domain-containing protein [Candidatus Neomarinimicrobiota bacterium]
MSPLPDHDQLRDLVKKRLGPDATDEIIDSVVSRVTDLLRRQASVAAPQAGPPEQSRPDSGRVIVSVFGVNQPGIVAKVSQIIAEHGCDIMDISQKLMQEFFTMILVVDLTSADTTFERLQGEFQQLAESLGVRIFAQHEDVFNALNRL